MKPERQRKQTFEDWPYTGETTTVIPMRKEAPVFIRFGHFGSECNEHSMNWSSGEYESGISVYMATINDNGSASVHPAYKLDVEEAWENHFKGRVQYALTGKVIAKGSDGEPVLMPSSIVIRGNGLRCGMPIISEYE